jgi:integrase
MSENTLNAAFRRMGYSKEELTAHGLRATASTFLNQSGLWNPDAIERALARRRVSNTHYERVGSNSRSYWDERVHMAQWWSNFLDGLRADLNPGISSKGRQSLAGM